MKKTFKAMSAGIVLGLLMTPSCAFADGEDTISVTVSVYDYNAADAGIETASSTGVILDEYKVTVAEGTTAADAVKKALEENNISITLTESYYGGYYVSEINGLFEMSNPNAEPDYSGWMLEYNDDAFSNSGISYLGANGDGVLSDGDKVEFHYSMDGGSDLGSVYYGNAIITSLTLNDTTINFTKSASYDENWVATYTYYADDKVLSGTGTKDDPFVLTVDLGELTSKDITVSCRASHYFTVDGIQSVSDFSTPMEFSVSTETGLETYYKVFASYSVKSSSTGDVTGAYALALTAVCAVGFLYASKKYEGRH